MFKETHMTRLPRFLGHFITILLFLLLGVPPLSAAPASQKISGPLQAQGDVLRPSEDPTSPSPFPAYRISPDGQRVVYIADAETEDSFELYNVPLTGGTVQKLSDGSDVPWRVFDFQISPDSQQVVFRAGSTGTYALYSVPIEDGTPVRLHVVPPENETLGPVAISADNRRVVFTVSRYPANAESVTELYSVPIGGGTPIKLNGTLVNGGTVTSFQLAADNRVVYYAEQETDNVLEIYSVPITGGTPRKLNGALVSGGRLRESALSPDKQTVVYLADQETVDVQEVYRTSVVNGTAVKISAGIQHRGEYLIYLRFSPDGAWVVVRADSQNTGDYRLHSISMTDGRVIPLTGALSEGAHIGTGYQVDAASDQLVYRIVDQGTTPSGVAGLYKVPLDGGASTKLSGTPTSSEWIGRFALSPDNLHVVYIADQTTEGTYNLYSVPLAGGRSIELHDIATNGGPLAEDFAFTPDSTYLVYRTNGLFPKDIFQVPVTGGPIVHINSAVNDNPEEEVNVVDFRLSPMANVVLYRADQEHNEQYELFAAPMQTTAAYLGYLPLVHR
jgi:Tol biopolymer transport system component